MMLHLYTALSQLLSTCLQSFLLYRQRFGNPGKLSLYPGLLVMVFAQLFRVIFSVFYGLIGSTLKVYKLQIFLQISANILIPEGFHCLQLSGNHHTPSARPSFWFWTPFLSLSGSLKRKLYFAIGKDTGNLEGCGFKHYKDRVKKLSEKGKEEEDWSNEINSLPNWILM